jgi:hypothetical protein
LFWLLAHVERLRHRREHEPSVSHRGKRHPPDALGKAIRGCGNGLQGEPRLAGPARPCQRQQARAVIEERRQVSKLLLATDERGRRHRQVRPEQRPQRRKLTTT